MALNKKHNPCYVSILDKLGEFFPYFLNIAKVTTIRLNIFTFPAIDARVYFEIFNVKVCSNHCIDFFISHFRYSFDKAECPLGE